MMSQDFAPPRPISFAKPAPIVARPTPPSPRPPEPAPTVVHHVHHTAPPIVIVEDYSPVFIEDPYYVQPFAPVVEEIVVIEEPYYAPAYVEVCDGDYDDGY